MSLAGYPEDQRPPQEEWRTGKVRCGRPGCLRRASHEWAYPCAINTLFDDQEPLWIPLCDRCDSLMNVTLLRVVGVPEDILTTIMSQYEVIQGDLGFDKDPEPSEPPSS